MLKGVHLTLMIGPAVPVPAFADPPFSLLHPDDAAIRLNLGLVEPRLAATRRLGMTAAASFSV